MEVIHFVDDVSVLRLGAYYFCVVGLLLYGLKKYGLNRYVIFVTLLFSMGVFEFIDYAFGISKNIYKVFVSVFMIALFLKGVFRFKKRYMSIFILYLVFTVSFAVTHLLNGQFNVSVLSQYVLTYSFPFVVYFGFMGRGITIWNRDRIMKLLYYLIVVQVLLSLVKVIAIGGFMESIVGSIQYIGGDTAVSLPILALLYLWMIRSGKFTKHDWIIAFSFLLVSVASAKRTPVLVFPVFLVLLSSFLKKSRSLFQVIKYVPAFFLLIYLGVRLNYTLNPEGVIWGSFDLEYLINYVLEYNFGTNEISSIINSNITSGRGGALLLLIQPEALGIGNGLHTLFGHGVSEVVREQSGRFLGGISYGIQHRGLMGAAVQEVYKLGFLGVGLYMAFIIKLLSFINDNKLKLIMYLWLFIDVFMYNGDTLFNPSNSFIFVVLIFMYSGSGGNGGIKKL
ncbi:MAG: hypothetical protein ACQETE_15170 [Bacteroidota bacterium]